MVFITCLKVKVSWQNHIEEVMLLLQWGWPQHCMLLPTTNSDTLLPLLPLQDPVHLQPTRKLSLWES